jgi:F-type H+-transporting ATPase subunit b
LKRRILLIALSGCLGLLMLGAEGSAAPRLAHRTGVMTVTPAISAILQSGQPAAESHEGAYRIINFLIMFAALVYFLRRPLKDFFADRSDEIRRGLEEGRKALAAAEARMAEVEAKVSNLSNEIAAFKADSERAMEAERERLKQSAEAEAKRLMEFAQTQIESATRAAKGELKRFAAGQAVELAEAAIRQRLDDPARRGLVDRFVHDLKNPEVQN